MKKATAAASPLSLLLAPNEPNEIENEAIILSFGADFFFLFVPFHVSSRDVRFRFQMIHEHTKVCVCVCVFMCAGEYLGLFCGMFSFLSME